MNLVDYFLKKLISPNHIIDVTRTSSIIIVRLILGVIVTLGRIGEGFVVQGGDCNLDLGMESGKIQDNQLSASSSFDWKVVGPQNSRIRHDKEGGAWCPANPVTKNSRDWLEVDLIHLHVITGVEVQGRFGGGQGQEFMEWFKLEYKRKNKTSWMIIDQVLPGNSNTYVAERRSLKRPIVASEVRFLPVANHTRTVCLRVELYGCPWPSGLLTYNLPQGHHPNSLKQQSLEAFDLTDVYYDGSMANGILENGIGCLVDGVTAGKYHSPYEGWMGWSRQELNQGPLWVEFFFDDLRCFEYLDVYVLEDALKQVGVFQKVTVYFSTDTFVHHPRKIIFEPNLDESNDGVRIVRIQLGGEVAKNLKLIIFLRSDWLLISEVQFSSSVVNTTDECARKTPTSNNRSPLRFNSYLLLATCTIAGSLCAIVAIAVLAKRKLTGRGVAYKNGIDSRNFTEDLLSMNREVSKNSIFLWNTCECGAMDAMDQDEESKINDETLQFLLERKLPDLPRIMDWSGIYDGSHKYTRPRVVGNYFGDKMPSSSPSPLRRFYPTILYHDGSQSPTSEDERISKHAFKVVRSNPGLGNTSNGDDNSSTITSSSASYHKDDWRVEGRASLLDKTSSVISMSKYFLKSEDQLIRLPREKLIYLKRLGEGPFGEICLCEIISRERSQRKKVALKLLKDDKCEKSKNNFLEEAKMLSRLKNRNIVRLVGVCVEETPHCLATEYLYYGNLKNFLQQFSCITGKVKDNHASGGQEISYDTLLYFGHQISCGMAYLENQRVIHRDLAARNCLVGMRGLIKISDFGMSHYLDFGSKFYQIQGLAVLPIRWMAWESVFLGMFSSKSDVWSFGITLWEILTFGKLQPYGIMSDEEVVENCQSFFYNHSNQSILSLKPTYLQRPSTCSEQLFSIMLTCWHGQVELRPSFSDLRNELFKLYDMGVVMLDLETSQRSWLVADKLNEYFSSAGKNERCTSEVSELSSDGQVLRRIESLLMTTDDDNDHEDGNDNDDLNNDAKFDVNCDDSALKIL